MEENNEIKTEEVVDNASNENNETQEDVVDVVEEKDYFTKQEVEDKLSLLEDRIKAYIMQMEEKEDENNNETEIISKERDFS